MTLFLLGTNPSLTTFYCRDHDQLSIFTSGAESPNLMQILALMHVVNCSGDFNRRMCA